MTDQEPTASDPWAPLAPATPAPSAPATAPKPERSSAGRLLRNRRIGPIAVLALAALIGLVVWLVTESRNSSTPKVVSNPPVAMNLSGLKSLSAKSKVPIYWAGPNAQGGLYEVTRSSSGYFVRYLPNGAAAGDKRPLLTVATFPLQNAYAVTKKAGKAADAQSFDVSGNGVAIYNKKTPKTIYVAYPGSNVQLKVYDPDVAAARHLVTSGAIQPMGSGAKPATNRNLKGPVAASPAALRSLATQLGHPIYWAGPRPNTTYELTESPNRSVTIRYLPKGIAAGATKPYLTIATYPVKDAFKVLSRTTKAAGTVAIKVQGGIGAYATQHPTHVYAAYRGADAQIEVFDVSATVARNLVTAGQVVPVG